MIRPSGIHVLVVDDDTAVRRSLSRCLERAGFRVSSASSGRDALTTLARGVPDVLLTDFNMPEMTGADLVEEVLERHPELHGRIFVASGAVESDRLQDLQKRTGCCLVAKPFAIPEIAQALTTAAASSRSPAAAKTSG